MKIITALALIILVWLLGTWYLVVLAGIVHSWWLLVPVMGARTALEISGMGTAAGVIGGIIKQITREL